MGTPRKRKARAATSTAVPPVVSVGIFAGIIVIIIVSRLLVTNLDHTTGLVTAVVAFVAAMIAFAAYNRVRDASARSVLSGGGWALMFHVCDVFWTYGIWWALAFSLLAALGINVAGIYREQRQNQKSPPMRR